jgi:hypothetical protein
MESSDKQLKMTRIVSHVQLSAFMTKDLKFSSSSPRPPFLLVSPLHPDLLKYVSAPYEPFFFPKSLHGFIDPMINNLRKPMLCDAHSRPGF